MDFPASRAPEKTPVQVKRFNALSMRTTASAIQRSASIVRNLGLVACLFCAVGSAAAETPPLPLQGYRLNLGTPGDYRLEGRAAVNLPTIATINSTTAELADRPYAEMIAAAAREAALDPALVHAVIAVESGYGVAARSAKGAIGLMQLMPETALRYGVRASELAAPEANLRAGTRYLRDLVELFDGRIELALAAYNAGENAVLRSNLRIPPFRETQQYVPAVLALYSRWREARPLYIAPKPPVRLPYLPGTQLDATRMPYSIRDQADY